MLARHGIQASRNEHVLSLSPHVISSLVLQSALTWASSSGTHSHIAISAKDMERRQRVVKERTSIINIPGSE